MEDLESLKLVDDTGHSPPRSAPVLGESSTRCSTKRSPTPSPRCSTVSRKATRSYSSIASVRYASRGALRTSRHGRIEWTAIHIYTMRDGKVLEDAVMTDALAIMQQLGLTRKAWPPRNKPAPIDDQIGGGAGLLARQSGFFLNPEASRKPNFESAFSLRPVPSYNSESMLQKPCITGPGHPSASSQ